MESFTCPLCGMTSYNPHDVREGYCGKCHAFTGELRVEEHKDCPPNMLYLINPHWIVADGEYPFRARNNEPSTDTKDTTTDT